ncbi:MAG TPA: YfiR family protein [Steroidobacteraceae bacterium]|nr:YfiR family protein [Steroidobacteraceae bacterium]
MSSTEVQRSLERKRAASMHRVRAFLRSGWLALLLAGNCALAGAVPGEYQVKAVFLFNFTHFVEWPADAFAGPAAPFVIGVLGRDPFGAALDEAVRGESVNGRPLVIQRYSGIADLKPCQILFIDRSIDGEMEKALASLGHQRTLTVSDLDSATPRAVIIRFLNENQKIRLQINVDSARNAGLTISSKLLRPAQVIGTVGSG